MEQGFNRLCVEEAIRHGEENADYLLREVNPYLLCIIHLLAIYTYTYTYLYLPPQDVMLRVQGLAGVKKESKKVVQSSVHDSLLKSIEEEGNADLLEC